MKGSYPNLASVDKRLDMMRTHLVMAILANKRYCLCHCNPIVAHIDVSLLILLRSFQILHSLSIHYFLEKYNIYQTDIYF